MMNRELSVVVMPTGALQTEWVETQENINKSSRMPQEEIYNRFRTDATAGLLFLGFSDKKVPLSPFLDYWRSFAVLFTRRLSRTPDLETLHHKAHIAITRDKLDQFADRTPLMPGSEYLSAEYLEGLWEKLNRVFSRAIKSYTGTVAEFIRTYSPDVHLVGRVFFIWWKTKTVIIRLLFWQPIRPA